MPLIVPRKTLDELSKLETPEQFRDEIFRRINLDEVEVFLNRVLVAVFIGHEVTKGGIIRPTETMAESIWQGKAALVLKVGPAAFQDDASVSFYGQQVEPGAWVTFRIGNSTQIEINSVPCRIVEDRFIEMAFLDPRHVTS